MNARCLVGLALISLSSCAFATSGLPTAAAPPLADEWLRLVDEGEVETAWKIASPSWTACSTSATLDAFRLKRRDAFGDVVSRALRSSKEKGRVKGLGKLATGKYLELTYDAAYSKAVHVTEVLVLEPDSEVAYRVVHHSVCGKAERDELGAK